jgi:thymidylate kinase
MLVEFIGCSGAGKSTLCRRVHGCLRNLGVQVHDPISSLLGHQISNRIHSETIQNLAMEAVAIPTILSSYSSEKQQLWSLLYSLVKNSAVSHWERLRLMRSVIRKIGTYDHVASPRNQHRHVLVDEGTIHLAHVIFGRMKSPLDAPEFITFLELVPMPNIVIWVKAPMSMIEERLSRRGDLPLPDRTAATRTKFLHNSESIFQSTVSHLNGRVRILAANNIRYGVESLDLVAEPLAMEILNYQNEDVFPCSN